MNEKQVIRMVTSAFRILKQQAVLVGGGIVHRVDADAGYDRTSNPIIKVVMILMAVFIFASLSVGASGSHLVPPMESDTSEDPVHILFFGDSITAGYEIGTDVAFPALIANRLDSLEGEYIVVNAGLSGETSAGGLRRADWILQQKIDVFVLELGGNDGLRGIDPAETKRNLKGIVEKVRKAKPNCEILLTGMEAPPNMGEDYTREFRDVFTSLAEELKLPFMPFILDGVAGDPALNLPDGIHPTEEGHQIIADRLWPYLVPLLP